MVELSGFAVASPDFYWLNAAIKIPATILSGLLLMAPAARAAESAFVKTLTPEERQSAGLTKLAPDELAKLESLIERYRSGQRPAQPAETVAVGPAAPAPGSPVKTAMPSWVGALITLEHVSKKTDKAEAIESRLVGDFRGWSRGTVFLLENGQRWGPMNSDKFIYSPGIKSPAVKIYPASLGSFWLEIEGVNQRCRVQPVKLE